MTNEEKKAAVAALEIESNTLSGEHEHWVAIRDMAQENLKRLSDRKGEIGRKQLEILRG